MEIETQTGSQTERQKDRWTEICGLIVRCPVRYVHNATCHLPEETGVQQCVLPAIPYGSDTWTLTKQGQNKLAAAQYAQRHIQGQNYQHLGQGADKRHRYNQQCETK